MLPGRLLDQAGIRDDAYFALTQVIAPPLAALTQAPGAVPPDQESASKATDEEMANVALLRLKGKLGPMLPKAELQTADVVDIESGMPSDSADAVGAQQ